MQAVGLLGAEGRIQRPEIAGSSIHGRACGREYALAELVVLCFDRLHFRAAGSLAFLLDVGSNRNRLQ